MLRRKRFTLEEICKIAGVSIPEKFPHHAGLRFHKIACSSGQVTHGDAFFVRGIYENGKPAPFSYNEKGARRAVRNGALCVFSTCAYTDEAGNPLPCVIVPDPAGLYQKLCILLRDQLPANLRLTTLTGTVGKTTTKEMMALVSAQKYRTLYSRSNANGYASVCRYMQMVTPATQSYIQETGAFYPGLVESEAEILRPDCVVFTNIGVTHIDNYGSVENILYDKTAHLRHMAPNGTAILNLDDPRLSQLRPNCHVIWYSLSNPDADYFAQNITYGDGYMEYDITGEGRHTHIRLYSYGEHNIINSVAAFAYGRWLGLEPNTIAEALGQYRSEGLRQNLRNIGGYLLYIDCYNASPNSMVGAVRTITRIPISEKNRRIAVVGDIARMGDLVSQVHADCGKEFAELNIDLWLLYGPYSRFMADELQKAGKNVLHTTDRAQLVRWISENAQVGDILVFKAGHPMKLAMAIDAVFGTTCYISDADIVLDYSKDFSTDSFSGKLIDGSAEIRKYLSNAPVAQIPARIQDIPLVQLYKDSFLNKTRLKEVTIENGLTDIGPGAFRLCTALTKLILPETLKIIEDSAFKDCMVLRSVSIPEGAIHIGDHAFECCLALETVSIPASVHYIGPDAFKCCPFISIIAPRGSYAEAYAAAHNINYFETAPTTGSERTATTARRMLSLTSHRLRIHADSLHASSINMAKRAAKKILR